MNDVQHFEAARGLGQRAMQEVDDQKGRFEFIFRSVLSRFPSEDEKRIIGSFFKKQLGKYRGAPEEAKKAITFGESKPAGDLDPAELAAWTLVANLILNMDEAIVRN